MLADRRILRLVELIALWGMAVSQPLLGILGDNTEFFIQNGVRGHSITVFAIGLSFLPPLGLWGLQMVLWRARRAADIVHVSAVGTLSALAVAQVVKFEIGLHGAVYVLAALICAVGAVVIWRRFSAVRTWVRWLAVVPMIALVLFSATSPAGRYARAGSGSTSGEKVTDVPVVMVMFDEFPLATLMDGTGGIDGVRFPNFARLAAGSTWYRMYSTQVEQTVLAVPSALSGRTPRAGASPTYVDHDNSLVSLLGASHELRVLETVTEMCAPALCGESARRSRDWSGLVSGVWDLFGQRISTKSTGAFDEAADVPAVAGSSESRDTIASTNVDDPTLARLMSYRSVFRGWIDEIAPGLGPTFDYAHVLLPHQPWLFSADGSGYVNTMQPEWNDSIYTTYSKWHVAVKQARHGLQTQMVDGLVGELLDHLEESGLYDDAMLIVTADHGAAFMEGYHLRGVMGDYANSLEVMSIPLFIKAPGQRVGAVNDANIQNVDLLPILADTASFRIPWSVDGKVPGTTTYESSDIKTLLFPVASHGRPKGEHLVSMRDFASAVLSFGSPGVPGDPLAALYAGTPHDGLRGRLVADLEGRPSSGTVSLDADVASVPGRVLLRGEVSGVSVSPGTWMAVSSRGRVVGLAPVRRNGRFETVVVESDGSPVFGARFHLIESGRLRDLTER